MKKILVLVLISLSLFGCGKVAQETSSEPSVSRSASPITVPIITPTSYALKSGIYTSGVTTTKRNKKVDANNLDYVYELVEMTTENIPIYKCEYSYDGATRVGTEYSWDPIKNTWTYDSTIYDAYTLDANNKFMTMEWHLSDGTLNAINSYTYPGYLGIGHVNVMNVSETNYTDGVVTGVFNYTTSYIYSADGLSVTENNCDGGSGVYAYNIIY